MPRAIVFYLGVFTSIFVLEVAPLLFSDPPPGVVPGIVLFSFFAAVMPAAFAFAGFAVGLIFRRDSVSLRAVFGLGALLAVVALGARYLTNALGASTQITGLVFSALLFVGGLTVSTVQRSQESIAQKFWSLPESRPIGVLVAFAEGALLVFPLLALLPFSLAVLLIENSQRAGRLALGFAAFLVAATALIALLRILKAYVVSGGAGLERVPKFWWYSATCGAGLVAIGTAIWLLERYALLDAGAHSVLGVGILGLPALLPWLHMAAESRHTANKKMEPTR